MGEQYGRASTQTFIPKIKKAQTHYTPVLYILTYDYYITYKVVYKCIKSASKVH